MVRRLLAVFVAFGILAACGAENAEPESPDNPDGASDGSDSGEDEPTPVRVMHSRNSEQLAIFVAYEAGYFADEGLDVEMREAAGAAQIAPAIAGGSGDLGLATATDLLMAINEGLDLVVGTGTSVNTPDNPRLFLMAGQDSGITEPSDLAGARIAVPSRGSYAELGTAVLLSREGVDPDSVSWVEMPFQQMNDSLGAGRIDAAVAVVPFTGLMASEGHLQLIDHSDLGDSVIVALLSSRRDWAESNPDAIDSFKRALDRAAERIADDPEYAKEVEVKYTGLPPEVVAQIPFGNYRSEVSVDEIQLWVDILHDLELIDPNLQAGDVMVRG